MDRRRQARAAVVGMTAALAYLGGAKVSEARPVRAGSLLLLCSAALAGVMTPRGQAKAHAVEGRLNNFFDNGGQVGPLKVRGDGSVTGDHNVDGRVHGGNGAGLTGNLEMNGQRINSANFSSFNNEMGATAVDIHGGGVYIYGRLWMGGHDIDMGGGRILNQG